jgi:hypothetical protein
MQMVCKDSASREKYKMNMFIFISEAQPIFAFAKIEKIMVNDKWLTVNVSKRMKKGNRIIFH